MTVMMIRSRIKPDIAAEVEAAAEQMFAAIERAQPAGVRYASTRVDDGETFVVLLSIDGADNPLSTIPEFVEFQARLKDWIVEPPVPERLTVVGSYRLF
jgi:hypothetical protein